MRTNRYELTEVKKKAPMSTNPADLDALVDAQMGTPQELEGPETPEEQASEGLG